MTTLGNHLLTTLGNHLGSTVAFARAQRAWGRGGRASQVCACTRGTADWVLRHWRTENKNNYDYDYDYNYSAIKIAITYHYHY